MSRIDIIGSNGNDGIHYAVELVAKILCHSENYPTIHDLANKPVQEAWTLYTKLANEILIAIEKEQLYDY